METGEMAVPYEADDMLWHLLHVVGEGGVLQGLLVRAFLASYPILLLGILNLRGHDTTLDCASRSQGSLLGPGLHRPQALPSTLRGHRAWTPPLWRPASSPVPPLRKAAFLT